MAYALVAGCAASLCAFGCFWNYMVIELPKDLGPYSQMNSLSMFMHRAFPMRETNDTYFEFKFEHILMLACVLAVLMQRWQPSRYELDEKEKKKKKGKPNKMYKIAAKDIED